MQNILNKFLSKDQNKQLEETLEKFRKNPHQFRFTVIFFLTSMAFGLLSVYLIQQKIQLRIEKTLEQNKQQIANQPSPQPSIISPTKQPSIEPTKMPGDDQWGWSFDKVENCNLLIPKSPYIAGYDQNNIIRDWKFTYLKVGNDFPIPFLNIFDQVALTTFRSKEETNENPPGEIAVYCNNNLENLTSNNLKEKIQTVIDNDEELKQANLTIAESTETSIWGKSVVKIVFAGGKLDEKIFYAFTTSKHLYLVNQEINIDDEQVKKDVANIFYGLIFLD